MASTKKPQLSRLEARRSKWGYIFLLPWLLVFLVFYAYPLCYGFYVSLTNSTLNKMEWIGLQNYTRIFQDYKFWRSLRATAFYAVLVIPFQVFLPMWAANVLRPHGKSFNTITKLLIYLPGVTCTAALVIAWKLMVGSNNSMISAFFSAAGLNRFSLFDSAVTAIPVLSLLIVFCNLGTNLIIYCAAIGGIPESYYEAAELDGASRRDQFYKITIPMLRPTIIYVIITGTIGALQIFVIPQLMTGGGPNYTTSSLLMMIYDSAFSGNQFGYASAIGVILFVITAIIAAVQFRVTQSDNIEY